MGSIQVAQVAMGYQSSGQRPACKNCKHGEELRADRMPPYDTASWRCQAGGFRTTAMAVCQRHIDKHPTSETKI